MDGVGDFVSNDEMVLGLYGTLHVIANGSGRFVCPLQ